MIDLYYWSTPNGHKIRIFLEEANVPYQLHTVDIGKGEQFAPEFLAISPNNKIPAIVDHKPDDDNGPLAIFESGAILWYLAEKRRQFIPTSMRAKAEVSEWLFWQMSSIGPMLGQNHHFRNYALEKIPYAIDRYTRETTRLYGVLDKHLADREWVAANQYTIADMAIYPWLVPYEKQGQNLKDFPHVARWFKNIQERVAVKKVYELAKTISNPEAPLTDEARKFLFGQGAHP